MTNHTEAGGLNPRVREIINRHAEYMDGFDRGQIRYGWQAVVAMIEDALSRPNAPDEVLAGEASRAELEDWRAREVQAIGAAISTRSWNGVETAYNQLRDKMDRVLRTTEAPAQEGE